MLDRVVELIGPNVVLWGAHLLIRTPGQAHPWHSDIESALVGAGTASVWIGLENTNPRTSLALIERSHRFDVAIQQEAHTRRSARGAAAAAEVEAWARARDPEARLATPEVSDGDALLFDGRLWHGSHNQDEALTRTAVLLQYADPGIAIRFPDFTQLEWPFRFLAEPRPPCLVVRGDAPGSPNRIVRPPIDGDAAGSLRARLTQVVVPLPVAWDPSPQTFRAHHVLEGRLGTIAYVESHLSTLAPGHSPHPPHRHPEEEILMVLRGEADLELPALPTAEGATRHRLRAGQLAYYPANFEHTLHGQGAGPVNYWMFKWRGNRPLADTCSRPDSVRILDLGLDSAAAAEVEHPTRAILDLPTEWLRNLHCHVSTRFPGTGYEAHVDAHELVIVTLEGEIEVETGAGQRFTVGPHGVVLHAAGEPHGLRVVSAQSARYVVFELHGAQDEFANRMVSTRPVAKEAMRPPAPTVAVTETPAAPETFTEPLPVRVALNALAHSLVYRLRGLTRRRP